MIGPALASVLEQYDYAYGTETAGPACKKCGAKVDLPDIGTVYCSPDCLPAVRLAPIQENGYPLPAWRVGLGLRNR